MRTEPTAQNRHTRRTVAQYWDRSPDAVGPCGHAARRVRAGISRWGSDSHRAERTVIPGTHPPVCGLATGSYWTANME